MWKVARMAREQGWNREEATRMIRENMPRPPSPSDEVESTMSKAWDTGKKGVPTPSTRVEPLDRDEVFQGEMDLWDLMDASPVRIPDKHTTALWLETMYGSDEMLFIGQNYTRGRLGASIRSAGDWAALSRRYGLCEQIIANPLSGRESITLSGEPTYRGKNCIGSFRYRLFECDAEGVTLTEQAFLLYSKRREWNLRSIVWSGGKSLHGICELSPPKKDLSAWERFSRGKFCRELEAHWCDPSVKNPDRLTRVPGVNRMDKNRPQRLLWLRGRG